MLTIVKSIITIAIAGTRARDPIALILARHRRATSGSRRQHRLQGVPGLSGAIHERYPRPMDAEELIRQAADTVRSALEAAHAVARRSSPRPRARRKRIRAEAEAAASRIRGEAEVQAERRLEDVRGALDELRGKLSDASGAPVAPAQATPDFRPRHRRLPSPARFRSGRRPGADGRRPALHGRIDGANEGGSDGERPGSSAEDPKPSPGDRGSGGEGAARLVAMKLALDGTPREEARGGWPPTRGRRPRRPSRRGLCESRRVTAPSPDRPRPPAPDAVQAAVRAARRRLPLLGALIGRLPIAALSLSTIIMVRHATGSFAIAGAVEASVTLAVAVSFPVRGARRPARADQGARSGRRANPVGLGALVFAAGNGAGLAVLAPIGVVCGATIPAFSSCMRTLWADLVPDDVLRQSAFALDAVLLEACFILGPLVTGGLVALGSPSAAVITNAAFSTIGTFVFAASRASRAWRGAPSGGHWTGPFVPPGWWSCCSPSSASGWRSARWRSPPRRSDPTRVAGARGDPDRGPGGGEHGRRPLVRI